MCYYNLLSKLKKHKLFQRPFGWHVNSFGFVIGGIIRNPYQRIHQPQIVESLHHSRHACSPDKTHTNTLFTMLFTNKYIESHEFHWTHQGHPPLPQIKNKNNLTCTLQYDLPPNQSPTFCAHVVCIQHPCRPNGRPWAQNVGLLTHALKHCLSFSLWNYEESSLVHHHYIQRFNSLN